MNFLTNAAPLSTLSDRTFRVGLYLPLAGVIAFASLGLYSVFHGVSSGDVSVPSLSILQKQRVFLVSQGFASGLNVDFLLFEAFIFIAISVGLLRLLTGLFSVRVLNSMGAKAEAYARQGKSPVGFFFFLLILLPIGIFASLNFEFDAHSNQVRALMEISPRAFICLMTFVFCGGVMFIVEGLLTLAWVILLAE